MSYVTEAKRFENVDNFKMMTFSLRNSELCFFVTMKRTTCFDYITSDITLSLAEYPISREPKFKQKHLPLTLKLRQL